MCGIGGILFSIDDREGLQHKIEVLNAAQRHRGPDGQYSLILDQHAFCHQRLVILDAFGGQQPFKDITGRYIIVYNGELYNYLELKQLLSDEYQFRTNSDTEVVLAAFIIWGESCLQRFNGMFAFLIWDMLTETAFAARDPLGVKPFVYYCQSPTILFASELKALLQVIGRPPDIDPYMLAEYVLAPYLSGGSDKAILKDVRYLEPGTFMRIDRQGINTQKYYQFNWQKTAFSECEHIQSTAEAIEESVHLSLRADVPIGIFLSGGLDSSLLAAISAVHTNNPLAAFSIAFENHSDIYFDPSTIVNSDDLPYAIELADHLRLPFNKVIAHHSSLAANLRNLAKINDRIPVWEQEFSQHFLSQAAAPQCKAVLVGDAADETNYGYFFLLNEERNRPLGLINLFGGQKRLSLLNPEVRRNLQPLHYLDEQYRKIALKAGFDFDKGGEESVLAMSTLVHRRWLERLLHNGDIHTMHFGLEARVPFANRSFLDVVSKIYPHHGFKNGLEKFILRQAAAKWLTPKFYNRKKSALPRDPRLGKAYQTLLLEMLQTRRDFIETFLHRPALIELCNLKKISETDRMILFNMICLINWVDQYAK